MSTQKTHREVKKPKITIRYLAEYMNGSERSKRTTLKNCKYYSIARVVQHDEAKAAVASAIRSGINKVYLLEMAENMRNRLADDQFERDVFDHNADYITRFANIADKLVLPNADILAPGPKLVVEIAGTSLVAELHFRLRRLTKTNKVKIGGGMLRYAKGKPLSVDLGEWQSALLFGLLRLPDMAFEQNSEPEFKLCATVDAQSGNVIAAPTNSVSRFQNAEAALATIADAWPNVEPPKGAIL